MHGVSLVADLAVVLGVAAITSVLARAARQPSILGYLLAGLIVGPSIPIPLFADRTEVETLAELGVILVMFAIGLEFRIKRLWRVLPTAGVTGLVQVSFLLRCGITLGAAFGWTNIESVFLGACICISSTMVVSRVFADRPVPRVIREHVLAILVIQDVLAIGLIAVVTGIAAGSGLAASDLAWTIGRLGGVLASMFIIGMLFVPRLVRVVFRLGSNEILAVFSLGLCFVVADIAAWLGYSVALGGFLAGMLVAESGRGHDVEEVLRPVKDVFAAMFFVSIGMTVDPRQAFGLLPQSLAVCAVVIAAQLSIVTVASLASGNGLRRSVIAGLSLGQIGEFSFILAGIGIGAGVVRGGLQPMLVTVAVVTAFTTPLLLARGDRFVEWLDRLLPVRALQLLELYEAWLVDLRRTGTEVGPLRRAVQVVLVDAFVLVSIFATTIVVLPHAVSLLVARDILATEPAWLAVVSAALLLAAPVLVSLCRNALRLGGLIRASVLPADGRGTAGRKILARSLQGVVGLAIVLVVGVPAVALLGPILDRPYGAAVLGAVLLAVVTYLWRRAGDLQVEYRSAAAQAADLLAQQGSADEVLEVPAPAAPLPPGFDHIVSVPLAAAAHAIGRTLAEINLRALTGATVVAIHRAGEPVLLPTGHERLHADDVLALTGEPGGVRRARGLLVSGPDPVGGS